MEPAKNPLNASPSRFGNKFNRSGFRNKAKWIKVAVFVLILVAAVAASWYTTQNQLKLALPRFGGQPILETEDGKPTREFYDLVTTEDYETLREKAPNVVTQPNIIDEEIRKEVDEITENTEPSNHLLIIDDLDHPINASIIQGDIVTWMNGTDQVVSIVGDGWQSYIPITPGTSFSQRFDFIGRYEYEIVEQVNRGGTIEVVGL